MILHGLSMELRREGFSTRKNEAIKCLNCGSENVQVTVKRKRSMLLIRYWNVYLCLICGQAGESRGPVESTIPRGWNPGQWHPGMAGDPENSEE